MGNVQLHYGDRAPYFVRAAAFVPGSTVTVVASDSKAVVVEPDKAFVPTIPNPFDPREVLLVAQGQLIGGRKMADAVRVHAQISHPDGGTTHATLQSVDVVGSPIQFDLKEPVPLAMQPIRLDLKEPAVEVS